MGAALGLSLGRVICQGCDAHGHKLDGLKQQKGIIPEFWRPEAWSQSVRRATLALTAPLPLPAFDGSWCPLTCGCIAPISASAFTFPSSLVSGSSHSLTRTLIIEFKAQSNSEWRRKWQDIPVFLPGKSHGQRSLVGYSPWGHKRAGHNLGTKQ